MHSRVTGQSRSIDPACLKCISSGSVLWKYIGLGFKLVYFILVALENLIQTFLQISQLAPHAQCCEIAASPPTVLTSAPSDVWKLMPTNHALLREPSRTGCHWAHLLYPPTACRNTHTHKYKTRLLSEDTKWVSHVTSDHVRWNFSQNACEQKWWIKIYNSLQRQRNTN